METLKLWARNGDTVRQAIELGELVHLETASEELTDEFLLFAIQSGLLSKWAKAFPDPRQEPEISREVILASPLAARFAGLYSMRKAGYVLRSATVLGALGYSVEVLAPAQGLSLRGTSDDKLISGDVLRKLLVKLETYVDPNIPPFACRPTSRACRSRCASAPRGGRSRALWMSPRLKPVRSAWPSSCETGITTTSGRRCWTMPVLAQAGVSILWTPPTWRSPWRLGPMSAVES